MDFLFKQGKVERTLYNLQHIAKVSHFKIWLRLHVLMEICGDKLRSTLTLRLELISACGKRARVNFWRVYEHTH
jgi:hypothetical protein